MNRDPALGQRPYDTNIAQAEASGEAVPFLDVAAGFRELWEEIRAAIDGVLADGSFILGRESEAFENDYAAYVGTRHCVGVNSGLEALRLALEALGVGPGDEVIVPGMTFIATWLAVSAIGARPVPAEPRQDTYNMDAELLEGLVTPRTRAIIPVHLYGQAADLDPIREFARRHRLAILDDAAQAHGALYRGRRIGGLCDATAWSFYPGKNLGAAGDGGAVTTDRDDVAERLRSLRNYGSSRKYSHEVRGTNSRLDAVQAAVLRVKLRHLDEWNGRRRRIAALYTDELADLDLVMPVVAPWSVPVWHLYVIRATCRERLSDHMRERGVATMMHYPVPAHLQGAYRDANIGEGTLPITERLHREVLSLPIGPHLGDAQAERTIGAVREFFRQPTLEPR